MNDKIDVLAEIRKACDCHALPYQVFEAVHHVLDALRHSDEWIKEQVIRGNSTPSTMTLFRNKSALAKFAD